MHDLENGPFAPLPGTAPRPRGLFVDRWGTLLRLPAAGRAKKASDAVFFDGVVDALFRASQAGWLVYLLGNEEGVARGRMRESLWRELQDGVLEHLRQGGIRVARDYSCVCHPEGSGKFRADSVYRLPNTGAFYHAAHVGGVDLARSWVVGDSTLELVAGWRAGCRLAAVRTGLALSDRALEVEPDVWCEDLVGFVERLLQLEPAR